MCIHVLLIYIQSECLTLYIINKNYQWLLTFGLLKYMLSSKLLGLFSYTCMLQNLCFNLYFIYLNLCYSCIFCFHFKDWRKWWIIHIASSVMLQNAENVMSKLNKNVYSKQQIIRANGNMANAKQISCTFYGQLQCSFSV